MQKIIENKEHEVASTQGEHLRGITTIAQNAVYGGFGEISALIFSFITVTIMTRYVGAKGYGIFLLANSLISFLAICSLGGMTHGIVRYVPFYKAKGDLPKIKGIITSALVTALILSIIYSILIYFSSNMIAHSIFHNPKIALAIKILIFSLPFTVMLTIFSSAIQGFQCIKELVIVKHILTPSLKLIFLIILFGFGLKLTGILFSSLIASIILSFVSFYILLRIFPFLTNPSISHLKELIYFSWPLLITQILNFILIRTGILMLGFFLSAKEVGIYGVIQKVAPYISIPLTAFNMVFAPLISELHTKGNLGDLERYFKLITKWVVTFSFPLFIFIILFNKHTLQIFGDEFVIATIPLFLVSAGELCNALTGPAGSIIIMTGRPRLTLMNSAIMCFTNIILNYLFIPRYGINGAALATCFSVISINLLRVVELNYILKIHPFSLNMLKPLGGGGIIGLLFYITKEKFLFLTFLGKFWIIIPSSLFIILYFIVLYSIGFDQEDRFILKKISQKILGRQRILVR